MLSAVCDSVWSLSGNLDMGMVLNSSDVLTVILGILSYIDIQECYIKLLSYNRYHDKYNLFLSCVIIYAIQYRYIYEYNFAVF
jgi:hypothetical protein